MEYNFISSFISAGIICSSSFQLRSHELIIGSYKRCELTAFCMQALAPLGVVRSQKRKMDSNRPQTRVISFKLRHHRTVCSSVISANEFFSTTMNESYRINYLGDAHNIFPSYALQFRKWEILLFNFFANYFPMKENSSWHFVHEVRVGQNSMLIQC